ncbi:MAG: thiol:disulfide interchange protein DsbA/DsbL [Limnohabitans sp.]
MKRRSFATGLLAASAGLGASLAGAQQAFRAGKDYLALERPLATDVGPGKVELIEFFWYSCPHCNAFEPTFVQWIKNAPKDVVVRRVPVAFRDDFAPQQRLYYTLEAMDLIESVHAKVFHAIHVERLPLNTDALIQAWVEKQGVDGKKFADTSKSFGVAGKVKRAVQLQNEFRVEGVPSLGIAGRFYTDGSLAGSMERALKVAESLLAQSRAAR